MIYEKQYNEDKIEFVKLKIVLQQIIIKNKGGLFLWE